MTFIERRQKCNSELLHLTEQWFLTCDPDKDELAWFRFWKEHCEIHFLKSELSECEMGIKRIHQLYESIIKGKVIQEKMNLTFNCDKFGQPNPKSPKWPIW